MDLQITPRIDLWFDGEDYGYQIDFEDGEVPDTEVKEGHSRTSNDAIAQINQHIQNYIAQALLRRS
ncbi:MAG: hypothetical protein HC866_21235 [Leptolyngbyaceae cyanobacterium RU_5_1]|nr:hypothetical protein [Leptolyngbyaceae cyanobacterium RU_5_1]